MATLNELYASRDAALAKAGAIVQTAEQANGGKGRDLSADERRDFDSATEEVRGFGERIKRMEATEGSNRNGNRANDWAFGATDTRANQHRSDVIRFTDASGVERRAYRGVPKDFLAELVDGLPQKDVLLDRSFPAMGHYMEHVWSDRQKPLPRELRDLSTTNNISAGYLTQEQLFSGFVVDRAYAATVPARAGAMFIPMNDAQMSIARRTAAMTFTSHTENTLESTVDCNFDRLSFQAVTRICPIRVSDELMNDASSQFNANIFDEFLLKDAADDMNTQALTGDTFPTGLINLENVGTVSVGGAITVAKVYEAMEDVATANYEPRHWVMHPTIFYDFEQLQVNSEPNHFVGSAMPSSISSMQKFPTTTIGTGYGVVGDFSKFVVGMRQDMTIRKQFNVLRNAWELAVVYRADYNTLDGTAFSVMSGITT